MMPTDVPMITQKAIHFIAQSISGTFSVLNGRTDFPFQKQKRYQKMSHEGFGLQSEVLQPTSDQTPQTHTLQQKDKLAFPTGLIII
jgi:hypothetical protein